MQRQRGQATVELAVSLPLVALVVLAALQAAVIARDQVMVVHAAREGARAAAVEPSADVARAAAIESGLGPARVTVVEVRSVGGGPPTAGDRLAVTVRRPATTLPIVGRVLVDVELHATVTVRVE